MKSKVLCSLVSAIALSIGVMTTPAEAQTEFTYQGELRDGSGDLVPDGDYDLRFSLYGPGGAAGKKGGISGGGTLIAGPVEILNLPVVNGRLTVLVDFGPVASFDVFFEVEVGVRPSGPGAYETLSPRQRLTPAPRASTAGNAESATNGRFEIGDEDCRLEAGPGGPPGLRFYDVFGFRWCLPPIAPPDDPIRVFWGPSDLCSLSINEPDPINPGQVLPGLIERDPTGLRLLGQNNQGCRLIFGPTMDCTIEIDPAGPPGLLMYDPFGVRICIPPTAPPNSEPTLRFGPTDDCSLSIDPTGLLLGLIERDPTGFRLLGQDNQGCRLIFGPTMDCTVEIDPAGPPGLLLRDPNSIRIIDPSAVGEPTLTFGNDPDDLCRIRGIPGVGLQLNDPGGLIVSNIGSSGKDGVRQVLMGPALDVGECRLQVNPFGQGPTGMILYDPFGLRVCVDDPAANIPTFRFGETDDCRIEGDPANGMCFSDPNGFKFIGGNLCVEGTVFAQDFVGQTPACPSDIRFKKNITDITNALDAIEKLRGVRYDWKLDEFPNRNFDDTRQIGVIAQEVNAVLPEVVGTDADGYHTVEYSKLTPVLIEAIKELNARELSREQKLSALENENHELRAELATLRDQVSQLNVIAAKLNDLEQRAAADAVFTGGE